MSAPSGLELRPRVVNVTVEKKDEPWGFLHGDLYYSAWQTKIHKAHVTGMVSPRDAGSPILMVEVTINRESSSVEIRGGGFDVVFAPLELSAHHPTKDPGWDGLGTTTLDPWWLLFTPAYEADEDSV